MFFVSNSKDKEKMDALEKNNKWLNGELKSAKEVYNNLVDEFNKDREKWEQATERRAELHEQAIENLEWEHSVDLKKMEFRLSELPEVKEIERINQELVQKIAVKEKELEMTNKIVDLNGDIIDIKDIVSNLMDKLPEVKISSLAVNNSGNCK